MENEVLTTFTGKKILVTGGGGYVASRLIDILSEVDCSIVRVDKPGVCFLPVNGKALVHDVTVDVCEESAWETILQDIDLVFHLAAQTSAYEANRDPNSDLKTNVMPMLFMLEACSRMNDTKTVLFSSTVTIVGKPVLLPVNEQHPENPITVYDLHKQIAENYLKYYIRQGIVKGAILRLANVYGPGPRSSRSDRGILNQMIRKAIAGEQLTVYGKGEQLRDYIFIDDVASAFIKGACNIGTINGHHFVLGSGQGYTITDAMNLVSKRVALKTGRCAAVVYVEPPQSLLDIEYRNFVADSSLFTAMTKWKAKYTLTNGIDRTVEAHL